jgi:hypothetical protein
VPFGSVPGSVRWLVGGTEGMLRVAAVAEDAEDEPFSLLFRLVFFSPALSSSVAFSVGLLELSAGTEGFEDDRRR